MTDGAGDSGGGMLFGVAGMKAVGLMAGRAFAVHAFAAQHRMARQARIGVGFIGDFALFGQEQRAALVRAGKRRGRKNAGIDQGRDAGESGY